MSSRSIRFLRRQKAHGGGGSLLGGGGRPPFDGGVTFSSSLQTASVCPRCNAETMNGSICRNCLLSGNSLTPKFVYDHLNRFVIGQERVKQVLSVAMFSHMQRVKANDCLKYLAKEKEEEAANNDRIHRALNAVLEMDDLEQVLSLRMNKDGKTEKAEEEEDDEAFEEKIGQVKEFPSHAVERVLDTMPNFTNKSELLQQKLKSALLGEGNAGKVVSKSLSVQEYEERISAMTALQVKQFDKSNVLLLGPTGSGKTLMAKTLAETMRVPIVICDATSLTAAGYVGEDVESVLYKLMDTCNWELSRAERGIVFLDEVDKIAKKEVGGGRSKDVGGESVQHGLLKMLEGTRVQLTKKNPMGGSVLVNFDTSNVLFICSGAFEGIDGLVAKRTHQRSLGFSGAVSRSFEEQGTNQEIRDGLFSKCEPTDLVEFGLIPEFVGRFSQVTSTSFLTEADLVRILVEPDNSVVNQMKGLFKLSFHSPVDLEFTPGALLQIAKMALQRKSGARGLKLILEKLLSETTYQLPDLPLVTHVVVDEDVVLGKGKCRLMTNEDYELWVNLKKETVPLGSAAEPEKAQQA